MSGVAEPDPKLDMLLRQAIEHRSLLAVRYKDKPRIIEPHDYGIHNGVVKLLGYQIGGVSGHRLPNWRWMEVAQLSEMQVLDRTFRGGRPSHSGGHHHWDKLFIRVKPADASS